MDLSSVVASFYTDTFVVTRTTSAATFGSDGRLAAATTTTVRVQGVEVPITGRELQRLQEGYRGAEVKVLFTVAPLYTIDARQAADTVVIEGDTYQVEKVEDWSRLGGYYRVTLLKVGH